MSEPETGIKAPGVCLCCGGAYRGGHVLPGDSMKFGLRVFYDCGASLSVRESLGDGYYHLLLKCPNAVNLPVNTIDTFN